MTLLFNGKQDQTNPFIHQILKQTGVGVKNEDSNILLTE